MDLLPTMAVRGIDEALSAHAAPARKRDRGFFAAGNRVPCVARRLFISADEPENLILHRRREMRAENERRHSETREEFRQVLETAVAISKAVNAMHDDLRDLRRGQKTVETEMCGLRGRIERIEDRQPPIDAQAAGEFFKMSGCRL